MPSPETTAAPPTFPPPPSADRPRGRLKVFFGMSPGVGKTYAMLQAARAKRQEGLEVVAGVVETHGRKETGELLQGLEVLPPREIDYRGVRLREFDLEGMLRRSPSLALVDELAHTNAPGSRHPKRYQDVRELLDQGIHVYTTLNVQHLESRADAVEALCGVEVRERVPDTVLEWADEIEVLDLSPERLRERLADGKVYLGGQAAQAADAFFAGKNLAALREMALRSAAERVNSDLVRILKNEREARPLPTGERILVAIGSSPFSEKLIRWTKRYATSLHASWVAAHVDSGETLEEEEQARLERTLELARNLGADLVATSGEDVADSLLKTARRELVTQIVVGRSPPSRWSLPGWGNSLTNRLIALSGSIAVHVVPGEDKPMGIRWHRLVESARARLVEYGQAGAAVAAMGLAGGAIVGWVGYWSVALLFLGLTVLAGFFLSGGPVLLLAVLSALTWNFFFVPPRFTLQIHSGQDLLLFLLLLLIAVTMGQLTARLRRLHLAEQHRERRTFALYRFLACLNQHQEATVTVSQALAHAEEVVGRPVNLILTESPWPGLPRRFPRDLQLIPTEEGVFSWVVEKNQLAGFSTENLPDVPALFLPVAGLNRVMGAFRLEKPGLPLPLVSRDLLLQMAGMLGRYLEQEELRRRLEEKELQDASERFQKTLLDTVSHELKTPLAIILSALEQERARIGGDGPGSLLGEAESSARRLLRNVNMLLDMTRFDGGAIQPKVETVDLPDLVGRLRRELEEDFGERVQDLHVETAVEVFRTDEALLFQLLNQLVRNAFLHAGEAAKVSLGAQLWRDGLLLQVVDNGPGLPEDTETLFAPFVQGEARRAKGLGLGLSIARRICRLLGGELAAANRPEGGACFTAILPMGGGTGGL